jgi:ATP-binding cassette subfamily C protein
MDRRTPQGQDKPVAAALRCCRPHLIAAAVFSVGCNVLYLVPTIYMMQVYNRVVPTGGVMSLVVLSLVAAFGLGTLSALDWLRSRLLIRASAQIEHDLAGPTLRIVLNRPGLSRLERAGAMQDFDTLRQAIASPGIVALLDTPWTPIYIVFAAMLHPMLGLFSAVSAVVLLLLAWSNERAIRTPLAAASDAANRARARQNHAVSYAAEVRALGLGSALVRRQIEDRAGANALQATVAFVSANHTGIIKFLRLTLQSAALGIGAWLAVEGKLSPGAIFAASLLLSRALQPVEQVNGAWKMLLTARGAYDRLTALFDDMPDRVHTRLPAPTGIVQVERLTVLAPQSDKIAIADISFDLKPGQIVAMIGMSGSGKSTLLRTLAGASPWMRGQVRFDAASASDWDPEMLAMHIGYLPQDYMLFPGSVKENISRFRGLIANDPAATDAATIAAASAIGAHEMILRLPDGYDTMIGVGGIGLSAGQMQRIALARALFDEPRILLLDEPTASLDSEAQQLFLKLLTTLRRRGATVLFSTHSREMLGAADKLLLMRGGRLEQFGAVDTVLAATRAAHAFAV